MAATIDKEERKSLLRDWLTATCQLAKVHNPHLTSEVIAEGFVHDGIKMNVKWVDRALYGIKGKPKPK